MHHRLKAFLGESSTNATPTPGMTVTLREISGILTDAVNSRRTWLQDFADDPIQIPNDLYDVLVAYRRLGKSA